MKVFIRWLEVILVTMLLPVGAVLGALTGIVVLGPIMAVCLPLGVVTIIFRLRGESWSELKLFRLLPLKSLLGWSGLALVVTYVLGNFVVAPLLTRLGVAPIDVSALAFLIEDNLINYLLFLIPVSWGSAAIGEELLVRGYLLNRLESLSGTWFAVIAQAAIFALAHTYQGWMGVINIFVLALVFGVIFMRCGRSLWPLIIAHGLIDTIAVTLIYIGRADLLIGADSGVS